VQNPKAQALLIIICIGTFVGLVHLYRVLNNVQYELEPLRQHYKGK